MTLLCLVSIWLAGFSARAGTTFTTLYNFSGGADGANPVARLTQGSDGYLYGSTWMGGSGFSYMGDGTVFRIALDGTFSSLYAFNGYDGTQPFLSALTEAEDGSFYGITELGGYSDLGTVFNLTSDGWCFPVDSFSRSTGTWPAGGLTRAADGNFYGTASSGGAFGYGTVFRWNPGTGFTTLLSFNGTNGAVPHSPLVQGSDSVLYGTTFYGGIGFTGFDHDGLCTGHGTLFRITTNGTFRSLFAFGLTNGAGPLAGLLQASDGNFYGTTQNGGPYGYGTVFRITRSGAFTLLHDMWRRM